jgi:hypothetical protein
MVLWRSSLIAKITKPPSMAAVGAFAIIPDREGHEAAILAALFEKKRP